MGREVKIYRYHSTVITMNLENMTFDPTKLLLSVILPVTIYGQKQKVHAYKDSIQGTCRNL